MQDVIERLRETRAVDFSMDQTMHMGRGYEWAKAIARYRQLKAVAEIDIADFRETFDDSEGDRGALLNTLNYAVNRLPTRESAMDLAKRINGYPGQTPSLPAILGFIEGAQKLWEEVADKI